MESPPKNGRGRPRVSGTDETVVLQVRIGARQFDALYQRAREARVTMPELIRRDLATAAARDPHTSTS